MANIVAERRTYPLTSESRDERVPPHASLRTLRKVSGLTLEQVSERITKLFPEIEASRGTLSAIETGSRGVSDLMLRALEQAFGIDEGSLTTAYTPRSRESKQVA